MLSCILYIHGFNSSPKSVKAALVRDYCLESRPELRVEVPQLFSEPQKAISQLCELVESLLRDGYNIGLAGSSLGGYYATFLAEKYHLKAALVNPAVKPYELLWTTSAGRKTRIPERFTRSQRNTLTNSRR